MNARVLDVPIPTYDGTDEHHAEVADLGARLAGQAATLAPSLVEGRNARARLRAALNPGDLDRLEALVAAVLV